MKKISYFLTGLIGAGLMMTACHETQDDAPVYKDPTTFHLNTPPMVQNTYELAPGGVVELTCSQPDYGFGAVVNYSVDVALDDKFEDYRNLVPELPTSARIHLKSADLAVAMCDLLGVTGDSFDPNKCTETVYIRAIASLSQVEGSSIVSNTISLANVKYYLAIQEPGYIYVVGDFAGWKEPGADNAEYYKDYRLYEAPNAIGSKVYSGVFDVPAGKAMFRFYTALTGWDADSYGSQADDSALDFTMENGMFEGSLVKGKGSYNFPAWEGGEMTITVNMAVEGSYTVTIQAGAVDTTPKEAIYICGNITGWAEPSEDNAEKYEGAKLVDEKRDGVFVATLNLPDSGDGKSYFRFYKTLSGWGAAQWASPTGENFDLPLDTPTTSAVGEGCFVLSAGTYVISVDSNNNTVTATAAQ